MKKKTIAIVSFILFFAVVGVVAFMLLNKKDNTKDTKTTTTTTTVEATTTTTTTKKEEKKTTKKTTTKKVAYTCPEGYKLDGTKCYKQYDATVTCTGSAKLVGGNCVLVTNADSKPINTVCPTKDKEKSIYYGPDVTPNPGCYYSEKAYTGKSECEQAGYKWNTNACYNLKEGSSGYAGKPSYMCSAGYEHIKDAETKYGITTGNVCFKINNDLKQITCADKDAVRKDNVCSVVKDATKK